MAETFCNLSLGITYKINVNALITTELCRSDENKIKIIILLKKNFLYCITFCCYDISIQYTQSLVV